MNQPLSKGSAQKADRWGRPNQGFGRTWPGSCPGALRGGVVAKAPDHLPYVHLAGTDL